MPTYITPPFITEFQLVPCRPIYCWSYCYSCWKDFPCRRGC